MTQSSHTTDRERTVPEPTKQPEPRARGPTRVAPSSTRTPAPTITGPTTRDRGEIRALAWMRAEPVRWKSPSLASSIASGIIRSLAAR